MARLIKLGMMTESHEALEGVESVVYRLNENGRELLAKEASSPLAQGGFQRC